MKSPTTTVRDALARSLCSRICDDRRDERDLRQLDRALMAIEREPRPRGLSVYLAASAAPSEADRVRRALAAIVDAGALVACTWPEVVARTPGGANPPDATRHERAGWSSTDLAEVDACDVLWMLVPESGTTRGAWVELGAAYAWGKRLVCSGASTVQSVFCALTAEFATDADAAMYLRSMAERARAGRSAALEWTNAREFDLSEEG